MEGLQTYLNTGIEFECNHGQRNYFVGGMIIASRNGTTFFLKENLLVTEYCIEKINFFHKILDSFTKEELLKVKVIKEGDKIYWIFPRIFDKDNNSIIYVPHTDIWCVDSYNKQ